MFDPVLLFQMAVTALIVLTMKPLKVSSYSSAKEDIFKSRFNQDAFISSDGKSYILHSGMWIDERILNR